MLHLDQPAPRSPRGNAAATARDRPVARSGRRVGAWTVFTVALAAIAFTARLVPMLHGGGLSGSDGYDDSVYYAAATAYVHGREPYDDFILLHPPGLMLFLTPFAMLARVTSDTVGQDAARVAFMILGAVNSVLVLRIGRRFGAVAAVVASLMYALSYTSLYAERTTTLEGLGATTLLIALCLLVRAGGAHTAPVPTACLLGAGLALGAGAGVKIWGVVPLLVMVLWQLRVSGRRAAAAVTAGAVAAVVAICLPFFAHAPAQMWRYVVSDQIGRPRVPLTLAQRMVDMAGLEYAVGPGHAARSAALGVVLVLLLGAMYSCVRTAGAGVLVALTLTLAAVLLQSPSFFLHYATLTAAPGVLVLGIGAQRSWAWLADHSPAPAARAALGLTVAVVVCSAVPGLAHPIGQRFPGRFATVAAHVRGCVTADDPTDLIDMNVLTRDLDSGCRTWVDVTGLTYDRSGGGGHGVLNRRADGTWQRQVMSYLLSGSATMVDRPWTELDARSRSTVDNLPVLARGGGFTLRRVH